MEETMSGNIREACATKKRDCSMRGSMGHTQEVVFLYLGMFAQKSFGNVGAFYHGFSYRKSLLYIPV
jgi:hypothetical protein